MPNGLNSNSVGALYVGTNKILPYIALDFTPTLTTISTASATITLANNTIYTCTAAALTSLTITLPNTPSTNFIAQVNFNSGSTPTTLSSSSIISWTGDNLNENNPILRANCSYTISFYYDGRSYVGSVSGYSI